MLTMQGVRLAHPALYPGWIVLGMYLGIYPMLFVALGRFMSRAWHVPVWLVVPVVWTGLEWIRSYAFTGFSAALLGHSQADQAILIQIADLGGTYLVSFLLAACAGWLTTALFLRSSGVVSGVWWVGLLVLSLGYGAWRLQEGDQLSNQPPLLRALLIQRNEPLVFTLDPNREQEVFQHYLEATLQGVTQHRDADLIVWPESMYTGGVPWRILGPKWTVPDGIGMSESEFAAAIASQQNYFTARSSELMRLISSTAQLQQAPPMLVGSSVYRYGVRPQAFGAAIHLDNDGRVANWYGKMHLVMFGEYIPFGDRFPWLYTISPLAQGATPGDGPSRMLIAEVGVAPSICFETMVEHVTGRGLRKLAGAGEKVDLIVNLTNDAWFHGSSILDHHRRCSQLVAVANRRPLLMAANQGPTVWIDGSGRRIQSLDYLTDSIMLAEPTADGRWSLYQVIGDAVCWPFGVVCLALMVHASIDACKARRLRRTV